LKGQNVILMFCEM